MADDWHERVRQAALSYEGTPWRPMGQVKGPAGGVDCATFLIQVFSEAGLLRWFKPDWYSQAAGFHSDGELYLKRILEYAKPVAPPWEVGDVLMFRLPGAPSCGHAGIYIGGNMVIHAAWNRKVVKDTLDRTLLRRTLAGGYRWVHQGG